MVDDSRKVVLDDGKEVYWHTPEELKEMESHKEKVAQMQKELEEAKQEVNPNWKAMREKERRLEDELTKQKELLTKANIPTEQAPMRNEDIVKEARKAAREVALEEYKERVLSQYGDKKETVKHYLDKLSAGEDLNFGKIDDLVGTAANAAGISRVNPLKRAIAGFQGASPEVSDTLSNTAKEMGDSFGLSEDDLKKGGSIKVA